MEIYKTNTKINKYQNVCQKRDNMVRVCKQSIILGGKVFGYGLIKKFYSKYTN